jgi:hypothetical protein
LLGAPAYTTKRILKIWEYQLNKKEVNKLELAITDSETQTYTKGKDS